MTDTAPTIPPVAPEVAPEPVPEAPAPTPEPAAVEATPSSPAPESAPVESPAPAAPVGGEATVGSAVAPPTATSTDELEEKLYLFDGLPDQVDAGEWCASPWTTPEGHVLYQRSAAINIHYTEYVGPIQ